MTTKTKTPTAMKATLALGITMQSATAMAAECTTNEHANEQPRPEIVKMEIFQGDKGIGVSLTPGNHPNSPSIYVSNKFNGDSVQVEFVITSSFPSYTNRLSLMRNSTICPQMKTVSWNNWDGSEMTLEDYNRFGQDIKWNFGHVRGVQGRECMTELANYLELQPDMKKAFIKNLSNDQRTNPINSKALDTIELIHTEVVQSDTKHGCTGLNMTYRNEKGVQSTLGLRNARQEWAEIAVLADRDPDHILAPVLEGLSSLCPHVNKELSFWNRYGRENYKNSVHFYPFDKQCESEVAKFLKCHQKISCEKIPEAKM